MPIFLFFYVGDCPCPYSFWEMGIIPFLSLKKLRHIIGYYKRQCKNKGLDFFRSRGGEVKVTIKEIDGKQT